MDFKFRGPYGSKFEAPEMEDMMGYYMQQNPGFVNNMMDMAMKYMSDAQNFYNFRFGGQAGASAPSMPMMGGEMEFEAPGGMEFEAPGMGEYADMMEDQREYQMKHGRRGRRFNKPHAASSEASPESSGQLSKSRKQLKPFDLEGVISSLY